MPFGARSSSLHMTMIAQFISRYLQSVGIDTLIYLDDVIGYAGDEHAAIEQLDFVKGLMEDLGLPLAIGKLIPPTKITWLGVTIDLVERTVTIPQRKLGETLQDFHQLRQKPAMTRRDVQRIAGRINHLGKACRPACLFMARILAYLRSQAMGYTTVSQGVRADLKWFTDFLPQYHGISVIALPLPVFNPPPLSGLKGTYRS